MTIITFLFFGTILGVFSSYKVQNFADAYGFMNGLRSLWELLLSNLIAYPDVQSPELISNLFNITVFNFLYTNILLITSPSFLTILLNLPPNPAIIDVVVGFSLVIFFTFNLIMFVHGEALKISNTMGIQILILVISISGSVIIIGIMFINFFIVALASLVIILSCVIVGLCLPLD